MEILNSAKDCTAKQRRKVFLIVNFIYQYYTLISLILLLLHCAMYIYLLPFFVFSLHFNINYFKYFNKLLSKYKHMLKYINKYK